MFEAVVVLCLAGGPCRPVLLPGYEAVSKAMCEALLRENPPQTTPAGPTADKPASCRTAPKPLDFVEVAPGVYMHEGAIAELAPRNAGDASNIGFVIGDVSVAVIDSGGSPEVGEGVWRAIRARTDLPVSHLILTHMHPDHILGAAVFEKVGAVVIGHAGLERALEDRGAYYLKSIARQIGSEPMIGGTIAQVNLPVADRAEIDLGGRVLDLVAWPTAHTPTDLTVQDRATGTLFTGDLVFDGHIPVLDGSLRGWQGVLGKLERIPAAVAVPGHGAVTMAWPDEAAPVGRYLDTLARDLTREIAAGERIGQAAAEAGQAERGRWLLFDAYNARNATTGYTELEWE